MAVLVGAGPTLACAVLAGPATSAGRWRTVGSGASPPPLASDSAGTPLGPAAHPPPPSRPMVLEFPPIEKVRLLGDLRLVAAPRPGAAEAVIALVVGSELDAAGARPDAARLTARVTAAALERRLGRALHPAPGWKVTVATNRTAVIWWVTVAPAQIAEAFAAIAQEVVTAGSLAAGFERERSLEIEAVRARLRLESDWVARFAAHRARREANGALGRGGRFDATVDDLGLVSLADCRTWHTAHLRPENSLLVVVGAVDTRRLVLDSEAAFARWRTAGRQPAAPPPDSRPVSPRMAPDQRSPVIELVDREKSDRADVFLVAAPPPMPDPNPIATRAAATLFCDQVEEAAPGADGAGPQMGAPMWCGFEPGRARPGSLAVGRRVPVESASATVHELATKTRDFRGRSISAPTLARLVQAEVERMPLRWESVQALARTLASAAATDAELDAGRGERDAWLALTPEAVTRAAASLLDPANRSLVVIGDAGRLGEPLARSAAVRVRGLDDFAVSRAVQPRPNPR